jgi:hypothetical protein
MWPRIIPLLIVSLLAGVSLLVSTPPALAAPSSAPDETWVTDGRVQSMEYVGDKVYLGGSFRQVGPNTGFGVALSATEGNWDASFPKVDGNVFAAVADGNGGWYIGGDFSKVGSSERSRLAHILPDGQVDSWSPSANNTVRALALSPDGSRLYLGGTFTNVNGSVRSRLAAVDTTSGSLNMRWNPRANGGPGR